VGVLQSVRRGGTIRVPRQGLHSVLTIRIPLSMMSRATVCKHGIRVWCMVCACMVYEYMVYECVSMVYAVLVHTFSMQSGA
jgi:hypothetical protein